MKPQLIKIITLLVVVFFPLSSIAAELAFYDTDNVGTPVAMWDKDGKKVWEGEYQPFGEEYRVTESPAENKKHFIGKEKDAETGLTYFGARYMDETTGRFISPDPVRPVDAFTSKTNYELLANPQRLNRYAYGLNNPYRYIDPDGEFAVVIAAYGGYVVASAIAAGIAYYGAPIAADTGKLLGSILWNKNTEANGPDFVGQPDGTVVDIHSTPKGSYDQPSGGRTDVLQGEDHGAGLSHTHDPIINTDPKNDKKFINGKKQPGRSVSAKDVKNIKSGRAKKTKSKKR